MRTSKMGFTIETSMNRKLISFIFRNNGKRIIDREAARERESTDYKTRVTNTVLRRRSPNLRREVTTIPLFLLRILLSYAFSNSSREYYYTYHQTFPLTNTSPFY